MAELMAASAFAIIFGLGYVTGRSSVRKVVVTGNHCQVIVLPPGQPIAIKNGEDARG